MIFGRKKREESMAEMRMKKLFCRKCVSEQLPSSKFCSVCGHSLMTMRSENEIRAEIKKISELGVVPSDVALLDMALRVIADVSLAWVLGDTQSPSEIIKTMPVPPRLK